MEHLTHEQALIYFAGLIDGEGHIGCQQYNNKPRPVIQLQMTHSGIVKAFADFFDMTFRELNSPSHQEGYAKGWKQMYHTRCECAKAYAVVKTLRPYLIVKADDADKALAYYDDRTCEVCGSVIPPERNTNSKTCSHECYRQFKIEYGRAYRAKKKEESF